MKEEQWCKLEAIAPNWLLGWGGGGGKRGRDRGAPEGGWTGGGRDRWERGGHYHFWDNWKKSQFKCTNSSKAKIWALHSGGGHKLIIKYAGVTFSSSDLHWRPRCRRHAAHEPNKQGCRWRCRVADTSTISQMTEVTCDTHSSEDGSIFHKNICALWSFQGTCRVRWLWTSSIHSLIMQQPLCSNNEGNEEIVSWGVSILVILVQRCSSFCGAAMSPELLKQQKLFEFNRSN